MDPIHDHFEAPAERDYGRAAGEKATCSKCADIHAMMIETRDALVAMKQRNHALEREKEELAARCASRERVIAALKLEIKTVREAERRSIEALQHARSTSKVQEAARRGGHFRSKSGPRIWSRRSLQRRREVARLKGAQAKRKGFSRECNFEPFVAGPARW